MCCQDFYAHSNWVELGYTDPYINLIRPDHQLENLAGVCVFMCVIVATELIHSDWLVGVYYVSDNHIDNNIPVSILT